MGRWWTVIDGDEFPGLHCSPHDHWCLTEAYTRLLRLEVGTPRINMQPILAALRDEIARVTKQDPERVQKNFEEMVERTWGHKAEGFGK